MLTFEQLIVKYQKTFNQLLNTSYNAYKSKPINPNYPKFCFILYNKLISFNHSPKTKRTILSKEDFKQQLSLIWYTSLNNYYKNKPSVSLKQYLIRLSFFKMRDYLKRELKISSVGPNENNTYSLELFPFKLDLNFVFLGNKEEPWNILYPYERYIIYLYFTKELSLNEISQVIHRDKATVSSQLYSALEKLRASGRFNLFAA